MGKYLETAEAWHEDGLIGGTHEAIELHNISLTSGASVTRGDILCQDSLGTWSQASVAADAGKPLCIAAEDFIADTVSAVTQGYFAGVMNRDKVMVGGAASVNDFEQSLRTQNIRLTK